jgi:translation initiation factor IF-3
MRPRGRFIPQRPEQEHRTNRQIRVPQVRLIGLGGEQFGVVSTDDALRRAQENGVDLVEVAPNASPPVCRLLDYGKFRYSKQKKDAEAKKKQHVTQLKELRVRPGTDAHDLERQLKKAQEFLEDGQRVKFTLRFRGREMAHQDLGRAKLEGIAEQLADIGWVEIQPRTEGRVMHLVMAPGQRKKQAPASASPAGPASGEAAAKQASGGSAPASAPVAS